MDNASRQPDRHRREAMRQNMEPADLMAKHEDVKAQHQQPGDHRRLDTGHLGQTSEHPNEAED